MELKNRLTHCESGNDQNRNETDDIEVICSPSKIQSDESQILRMVKLIHEAAEGLDGSVLLVALTQRPQQAKSRPTIFEFDIGDVEGMGAKALELTGQPWTNVYWVNCVMPKGVSARGSWGKREDVVAVIAQVIDADADTGKEGNVPLQSTLTLVTSSNQKAVNRQHVYLYAPDGRPTVDEAVPQGEKLRKAAQADSATGGVPHLYRLAGTLNWATPTKLQRGRSETPQVISIEGEVGEFIRSEVLNSLTVTEPACKALTTTPARMSLPAPLSAKAKKLLERHDIDGDRSPAAFAFMAQLHREGKSHDQIRALVLAHPYMVGERYVRDGKNLDADIRSTIEKCDDLPENRDIDQSDMPQDYFRHLNGRIYRIEVKRTSKDEPSIEEVPFCSPLRILGRARDPDGGAWARVVDVRTQAGSSRRVFVPEEDLYVTSGDRAPVQRLAREGLTLSNTRQKLLLNELLLQSPADKLLVFVDQPGWIGSDFALPSGIISAVGADEMIWSGDPRLGAAFEQRGTLEEWKEHVAKPSVEHPLLLVALVAGLTGPLLGATGAADSFGIHLFSDSSDGKTTALHVAGSLWGPPDKFVKPWRGTDNGLEFLAETRNHTLLALDELGQVEPHVAGRCAYMLANGQGKTRGTKIGGVRKTPSWTTVLLSTGEPAFGDYLVRAKAGQMVRVIDTPVPLRNGDSGVFRGAEGDKLSPKLRAAASTYCGTAGPAFVEKLVQNRDALLRLAEQLREEWRELAQKRLAMPILHGQVHRVMDHLGHVYAAGQIAIANELLPVDPALLAAALLDMLESWVSRRGGAGALEDQQAIEATRGFLMRQQARFASDAPSVHNQAGVRDVFNHHGTQYDIFAVFPEVFKMEICASAGLSAQRVAQVLEKRGFLVREDDGHLQRKTTVNVAGRHRARCYWIKADIIEAE